MDANFADADQRFRSMSDIPPPYNAIFKDYTNFNFVQSNVLNDVLNTKKSIVVSAPTGSGKTVIFELAILYFIMKYDGILNDLKFIYVAPLKALCSEKHSDWRIKFAPLGLTCLELTGDSDITDINELTTANILVTTPEKWDSITRKWRSYENIVNSIKLFMIDEVHLLNEDGRGAILEAIVSRMKTIQYSSKSELRFVAASATIPNIEDLSSWLGGRQKVAHFQFSEEDRPVRLEKHILGFNTRLSGFKFDMSLNYKLANVIKNYSHQKPTLVFCSSRNASEMAANVLLKEFTLFPLNDNRKSNLIDLSKKLQEPKLRNLLLRGIAFHHAGLTYSDRSLIEDAFRNGSIMILLSTNTLAVGVNLPAHLVIIKSTELFLRGSIVEYSESTVLQMIGRAGRPQYDASGVAVIMTQKINVQKYENLINGSSHVESHLHKHLAEHLNSEIVLQTITDRQIAMEWIQSTFLYVRAVRCPTNYGFTSDLSRHNIENKLEEMCLVQINELEQHGLITKEDTTQLSVKATSYGKLMANFYISFETMKLFRKIRGNESYLEIMNVIVHCKEFSEFNLRVGEKKALNEINNFPVRFPIRGKIKTKEDKVSCLAQAGFGNITIPEPTLKQELFKIMRLGQRISKCLLEYIKLSQSDVKSTPGTFKALLNAVIIAKCFNAGLWENSEYVSKQLQKISTVYANLLVRAGKTTFKSILETDTRTIETILNKQPPFGEEIHETVKRYPVYDMHINMKNDICGQLLIRQVNMSYTFDGKNAMILIGDAENNVLLVQEKVNTILHENGIYDKTFELLNKKTSLLHGHLIHESLESNIFESVGVDVSCSLSLEDQLYDFVDPVKKQKKRKVQKKLPDISDGKRSKRLDTNGTIEIMDETILKSQYDVIPDEPNTSSPSYKSKLSIFKYTKSVIEASNSHADEHHSSEEGVVEYVHNICSQIIDIDYEEEQYVEDMMNIMETEHQELEQNPFLYEKHNTVDFGQTHTVPSPLSTGSCLNKVQNGISLLEDSACKKTKCKITDYYMTAEKRPLSNIPIEKTITPANTEITKKIAASASSTDLNRNIPTPYIHPLYNYTVLDLSTKPNHNDHTVDLSTKTNLKANIYSCNAPTKWKFFLNSKTILGEETECYQSKKLNKVISDPNNTLRPEERFKNTSNNKWGHVFRSRPKRLETLNKPLAPAPDVNETSSTSRQDKIVENSRNLIDYLNCNYPMEKSSLDFKKKFIDACAAKRAICRRKPYALQTAMDNTYSPEKTQYDNMDVGYDFGSINGPGKGNIQPISSYTDKNFELPVEEHQVLVQPESLLHLPKSFDLKPEITTNSSQQKLHWQMQLFFEFFKCFRKLNAGSCNTDTLFQYLARKFQDQGILVTDNGNRWQVSSNSACNKDKAKIRKTHQETSGSTHKNMAKKGLYRLRLADPKVQHTVPILEASGNPIDEIMDSDGEESNLASRIINRSVMKEVLQRKLEEACLYDQSTFATDYRNFFETVKMKFSQCFEENFHGTENCIKDMSFHFLEPLVSDNWQQQSYMNTVDNWNQEDYMSQIALRNTNENDQINFSRLFSQSFCNQDGNQKETFF